MECWPESNYSITGFLQINRHKMSWGGATTIVGTSGTLHPTYQWHLDNAQNTTTARFFEMYNTSTSAFHSTQHGIEFRSTNTGTELFANSSNNNQPPVSFTKAGVNVGANTIIALNDVIGLSDGTNNYLLFTVTSSHLWSTGPTTDQYGRLPSTAVSKSVNLGRVSYRTSGPGDNVVIDANPTLVTGGYQTLNVPSAIFCPRDRAVYKDALFDRTLFENLKQPYTRNGITYNSYIFGGCIPNVLDNIYNYVELQAGIPFQFNSTGDWYVNYTTHAYRISDGQIVELITGFSRNPTHSVLLRYNITTNAWIGVLANITETPRISLKTLKLQSVSPNSTQQWNGFSNLSNTTVDLLRFMVEIDTNVGSISTPPQSEVEVAKNGGGKPDRYPLIMTNLFNRNRSLYSIGMTHKDTWDLFL